MTHDFGHQAGHCRRTLALTALTAAATAGLLAACSSTSGTATSSGNGASSGSSSTSTLSTRQLNGVGTALVDQSGKTLYSPDQEAGGTIKCTDQCLSFWTPVTVDAADKPTAPTGVTGTLGTIKRPDDGQTQVTFNGKPLYTFRLDQAPGDDKGENFQDSFNGTTFTWRAIPTSGSPGGSSPTGPSGYGSGGGNQPGY